MKKLKFVIIGLALTMGSLVYAYDDGDFQVWNTDVEEFKISKGVKLSLEEEFRWGDNANEFFYHHYDAGMFRTLNEYWNIGGGYRQIYELKSGDFKVENAPYLTATLFLEKQDFAFDSRSRLEYRHFDYQTDSWRYRNKFTLKFPWKFTKWQFQPYTGDEFLFGFGAGTNEFNQNRFFTGVGMNLYKSLKGDIYYMLVGTKSSGKWSDSNVLGTKFKISF